MGMGDNRLEGEGWKGIRIGMKGKRGRREEEEKVIRKEEDAMKGGKERRGKRIQLRLVGRREVEKEEKLEGRERERRESRN